MILSSSLALMLAVSSGAAGNRAAAAAKNKPSAAKELDKSEENLLLLDFKATLGANPDLAKLLQDLFTARLQETSRFHVVASSDVQRMLDVEQQKQLTGCDEGSCLSEIGGALGARWLVSGGLSLLGGRHVLTLKLLDTKASRVDNQIAEQLPDDDSKLAESMRRAAYALLRVPLPALVQEERPWYKNPWIWGGVAATVGGGIVLGFALTRDDRPSGNLGRVVLDAR